ncbi:MAG TPA: DNA translocase FtsK, partial [Bacilli bacterium]|nr:DNA translocase FtsK [Bacilli bacterium]
RPSVQVITGNIKANIPSRVAFMTASVTDSMTILGCGGAENLLGYGDMLVDSITTNYRGLLRVQAPYVQVREVLRVTNYLRNNYMTDFYPEFLDLKEKVNVYGGGGPVISDDLYQAVLDFTLTQDTISISRLQQNFNLGWPRARQLYDQLMQNGIIEPPDEANSAKGAVVIANKRGN